MCVINLCVFDLWVFDLCLFNIYATFTFCVWVCLRWVLATCIALLTFCICYLFCSSWVWPFPWRCFIRSTEQGRSTTPSQAPGQTEAYGTDSGRKAPLQYPNLISCSPLYRHQPCVPFLLLSLLSHDTTYLPKRKRDREEGVQTLWPRIPIMAVSFSSLLL